MITLFAQYISARIAIISLLQVRFNTILLTLTTHAWQGRFSKSALITGYDKANKMKIYDLANPSQEPQHFQAADSVRFASYHSTDNLLLSTYVDKPNIR